MSLFRINLDRIKLVAIVAAASLGWLANAQAQTGPPADTAATTSPSMTGAVFQGMPGVWINQGKHLWFCQWQGNAAPRNSATHAPA